MTQNEALEEAAQIADEAEQEALRKLNNVEGSDSRRNYASALVTAQCIAKTIRARKTDEPQKDGLAGEVVSFINSIDNPVHGKDYRGYPTITYTAQHVADAFRAGAALQRPEPQGDGLALAVRFHETYERLAPSFGYETREDTKAFDPDSPNGKLMVAVCTEILTALRKPQDDPYSLDALRGLSKDDLRTIRNRAVIALREHGVVTGDEPQDDGLSDENRVTIQTAIWKVLDRYEFHPNADVVHAIRAAVEPLFLTALRGGSDE